MSEAVFESISSIAKRSVHRTQWAAQFAVASELCKRDHQVAFTMGNHPKVDLMVISPSGAKFAVDVKGLYKKSFWLISPKTVLPDLFYILAHVPDDKPNEFFVLTQQEANAEIARYVDRLKAERQRKGLATDKVDRFQGLLWSFAERFKDRWEKLPG